MYHKGIKASGSAEAVISEPKLNKQSKARRRRSIQLFLIALPFLCLAFLFSYMPLYGWIYAFFNYDPPLKLSQCDFVGFYWFQTLFANPTQAARIMEVLRNTFAISGLNILTSWVPMVFAIFLAEITSNRAKKTIQVLTTLPNFISWVLVYAFAYALFSYNGPVNMVLSSLNLIESNVNWLALDNHTWLAMTLWSMWKGTGWGAILYMAAIAGIDQELYEAAAVDGAGRFRMMWHITVPGLLPTFFVLLMLSVANFLNNGLDQYFVFQNSFNQSHIEVLDLYVYNLGIGLSSLSMATAVGILKSFVSIILLTVVNLISKATRGATIV
jgi:putative aldouronate transport system permease protein